MLNFQHVLNIQHVSTRVKIHGGCAGLPLLMRQDGERLQRVSTVRNAAAPLRNNGMAHPEWSWRTVLGRSISINPVQDLSMEDSGRRALRAAA